MASTELARAEADSPSTPQAAVLPNAGAHQRLLYLDGWRGLSILGVLVGHFASISIINGGRLGVEMFFVLSGRLMAQVLFVDKTPLPKFFRRRIARVWPALFAFVLVMAVVFHGEGPLQVSAFDVATALTFTLNYARILLHPMPAIEHIWSLCIEEWTYVLLAGIAFCTWRMRLNPMLACLVGAGLCMLNGVLQTLAGYDYYQVYWRTDVRMSSILIAAALFLALKGRKGQGLWWLPLLAGALGFGLQFQAVPDPVKYTVGSTLIALAMVTLDRAPRWVMGLLSHPVIVQVGIFSFSLYLWQQPFYQLLELHAAPKLVLLGAAIACALASFYLVEQPARRFLNTFWKGPRRVAPAA